MKELHRSIWLMSELFYPDETSTGYILTEIADAIATTHKINVIAGPTIYSNERSSCRGNLNAEISVFRVNIGNWNKNRLVSRVIRMVLLSLKMGWLAYRKVRQGDKVIVVTNPAPLLLLISSICKIRGAKLIVIVHDVFPENIVAAGLLKEDNQIYRLLLRIFKNAYRKASKIIVLGRDMQSIFLRKTGFGYVDIPVIPNWADTESIFPVSPMEKDIIRLQFAGNMGRVQGIMPFLESFKCANNDLLTFDLYGDGALRGEIQRFIERTNLSAIKLRDPFSRDDQHLILNKCDIGLVSLADGMLGLGVPSKSYNIMAAGKPILYIGDPMSEIARLIVDEDIGWTFDAYDSLLIEFLRTLKISSIPEIRRKGANSRRLAEKRFSKEKVLKSFQEIIVK